MWGIRMALHFVPLGHAMLFIGPGGFGAAAMTQCGNCSSAGPWVGLMLLCSKFTISSGKKLECKGQYLKKGQSITCQPACCIQFLVDCRRLSSLPHISFTIGHHEYKLTAEQYVVKVRVLLALCSWSGPEEPLQGDVLSLPGVHRWPNLLHEWLPVSWHPNSQWLALDFRRCLYVCLLLHFWPWEW